MDQGWRIEQNGSHYLFGCYGNSFAMVREAFEVLRENGDLGFGTYREQFVPRTLVVGKKPDETVWSMYLPETLEWPDQGGLSLNASHYVFMGSQWAVFLVLYALFRMSDEVQAGPKAAKLVAGWFPLKVPSIPVRAPRAMRAIATIVALPIDWVLWPVLRAVYVLACALAKVLETLTFPTKPQRGTAPTPGLRSRLLVGSCKIARWAINHEPLRRTNRFRKLVDRSRHDDRHRRSGRPIVGPRKVRGHRPGKDLRGWLAGPSSQQGRFVESSLVKSWYDAVIAYVDGGVPRRLRSRHPSRARPSLCQVQGRRDLPECGDKIGDAFIAPITEPCNGAESSSNTSTACSISISIGQAAWSRASPWSSRRARSYALPTREAHLWTEFWKRCGRLTSPPFVPMPVTPKPPSVWPNQPVLDPNADLSKLPEADLTQSDSALFPIKGPEVAIHLAQRPQADEGEFHEVVFALPLEAVRSFPALSAEDGWRESLANVQSVGSQSMRIWGMKSLKDLGWEGPPPILSGFANPYSTWEDNEPGTWATRPSRWPFARSP